MKAICFYFQIHQPFRLKRYRFFDIGNDHYYYDDFANDDFFPDLGHLILNSSICSNASPKPASASSSPRPTHTHCRRSPIRRSSPPRSRPTTPRSSSSSE